MSQTGPPFPLHYGVTQGQSAQSKGLVVTRPELAYRPCL